MNIKPILIIPLAALFLVSVASAIGISPGRIAMNFTPSMEYAFDITIINNAGTPLTAALYVRGDLAQYVTIPVTKATVPSRSDQHYLCHLKLPSWLAGPKLYDTRVGVVEVPESGSGLGAVAGVEMQLWIDVSDTPRPDVVYGELPPPGSEPQQNETLGQTNTTIENNQSGIGNVTGSPMGETETPILGALLVFFGAIMLIVLVLAFIIIKRSHK